MSKYIFIGLFALLGCVTSHAQSPNNIENDGDTIPRINIPEVKIMPPPKFKNNKEFERYKKLIKNIKKTLPYARLANQKLYEMDSEMRKLKTDKERKAYLEKAEKEMFAEFEAPLKKLSFTQGRLLIKLIDRETGKNSYVLIKELKGSVSAFFWQSVARMFGSNLKDEYDKDGDDRFIEYIINQIDLGLI